MMHNKIISFALGVWLTSSITSFTAEKENSHALVSENGKQVVQCEGRYPGHVQGVCVDSDCNIYWSWTTSIVKTDGTGKILAKVEAPTHQGDLCYVDGSIYVAVNLGKFNQPAGQADSWVYQYDAKTLKLIARYEVQEAVYGAGGIEFVDGRFLVVGGLPGGVHKNYVFEYDRNFKFIKTHEILSGWTKLGIQTAFFKDNYWWFGCYGEPNVMIRTDKSFKNVSVHKIAAAVGITTGGSGPRDFLLAINKRDEEKLNSATLVFQRLDEKVLEESLVR